MEITKKKIGLVLGPLLFVLIKLLFHPKGLTDEAVAVLASTVWIAVWWITEAVDIPVTSLLPIVLFPLSGGMSLTETTASYGHQFIFMFLGGFIIAIAIEKWSLHKRIALTIIKMVGTNVNQIILGFMIATAFLSMWISNTATAVMILPVGIAVVKHLKDNPSTIENENVLFGKMLMLAIAYSSSIGGMATLIGTPPNLVLVGVIQKTYNIEISFLQWFIFGFPLSIVLLYICWLYLTKFAFKIKQKEFPGGKEEIENQLQKLGPITYQEKMVFLVFVLTALAWILRSFVLVKLFPKIDDTIIAILFSLILFVIPSKKDKEAIMTWKDAVTLPWGILLLFGGGMALALGFETTGLAAWIGDQLTLLEGASIILLLVVLIAVINFLTEITSNTAITAMLLPVLVSLSLIIDIHPYILLVSATLAASCAFMLPVATPPNAVVFGAGYLKVEDMVRKGIWMNIISIVIIALFGYYVLPFLWDLN
ncbi:Sodium-dependent dicarboxylate transporter SdcS [Flavobacterium sp. 9AF]|uniref:SLC13 family permease n=1 Tax=Flavobacterium sp. 9AF TaxID=2653142 RepID=UPI0012F3B2BC|nr:DASS family sodium-coupled anion symporter [Flavobacterium sp. 9AF]VXB05364.1 Sodium-dependent dicarboxylate transporter SdcS [Flavobacterium sp. 9AF]